MALGHGYDYVSATRIPLDAVAATGAQFVGRYLDSNPENHQELSAAEAEQIHARGLGILPILEHENTRANDVSQAETVAKLADGLCDALGVPLNVPIVHCDDSGSDPIDQEPEFFRRVAAASRRPVMVYGSLDLARVVAPLGVTYFWVVGTWGSQPTPERGNGTLAYEPDGIHLVQLANTRNPVISPDIDTQFYDTDIILRPFPTWGRTVGDDVAPEDVYNYIFADKPFGVTRFAAAFQAAMQEFMTPATDLAGTPRSYLDWIAAAARSGVGNFDPAAIKAAVQAALAAMPAESRQSNDDVADAVVKALMEQPLVAPDERLP